MYFCAGSWKSALVWLHLSPKYQLVSDTPQTKIGLYAFHCPWPGTIVWFLYHCFGVCFFIGLLKDIILYATGLWKYYNSHSEPVLNKILAKQSHSLSIILPPETKQIHTLHQGSIIPKIKKQKTKTKKSTFFSCKGRTLQPCLKENYTEATLSVIFWATSG